MINYVAHWDRILIQSRSKIVNELNNFEFRSICPIIDDTELKKNYSDSLNWQISREKYFDFSAVFKLRKILKSTDNGSIFHIFTLKTGFLFMISNLFLDKKFKSTLSVTGLGYFFSKNTSAKIFKILLRPIFLALINKTFQNIIYQNTSDEISFNKYSKFKNNSHLIESSGINTSDYFLKDEFNENIKIILAGRLLKDKGINEFIQLAKSLEGSEIEFFIAGDIDPGNPQSLSENELNELKKLNYITYLGFIDIEKDLHKYDVLVSMSAHEGFSRVLLESSFVGLYIVSLENNGTKFISELENSELITSLQIDSFIKVLENLKKIDLKLSSKNRDFITKNYSSTEIAKHFKSIYETI